AYGDLEWARQEEGFDVTYDKRLSDRLRAQAARPVREHLTAAPAFLDRSLHFLENHDEPRAAAAFPPDVHRAAAVISFLAPGLRLFHEGELEGRRAHAAIHLARRAAEEPDAALQVFYERLLACLRRPEAHDGAWHLAACRAAWAGNLTWDHFIVFTWEGTGGKLLVAVNYGPTRGQCYAEIGLRGLGDRALVLTDLMGETRYERDGRTLAREGLYLDLPPWGFNVFEVKPRGS
ncbi:MAG TPA: alpha-amylase, partial [Polyangia bacterium]|nr:alpha-amylase [Polyangia bacterium]